MDDLNEKLAKLLSSPDSLSKIQSALAAVGAEPPQTTPPTQAPTPPSPSTDGLPDMAALGKLMPLLSGMDKDDDDTRLLKALKPYLHGKREQRLEETMQLLKLTKLLPLLQGMGMMGGGTHGE